MSDSLGSHVLPTWRAPLGMGRFRRGLSFQAASSSMRKRSMLSSLMDYGLAFALIGENKAVKKLKLEKIRRNSIPTQ